ncbi:MAG: helix-turn-helix transcriptional regulator [Halarchaeum sp.]
MDAYEAARYLFGSANRLAVLWEIRDRAASPRDVADAVDVSRATAQRCLRTCSEHGWVERADGGYRLTAIGDRVIERCLSLVSDLTVLDDQERLLEDLPRFEPSLPLAPLASADVVAATSAQPHRAAQSFADHVRESDSAWYRCVAPAMSQLFIDAFSEKLAGGAMIELVCSEAVLDAERETRPANVTQSLDRPGFELYVRPDDVDYSLVLTDREVFVGATDGTRAMTVGAWSADERLYEWANDRYVRERARAERVP